MRRHLTANAPAMTGEEQPRPVRNKNPFLAERTVVYLAGAQCELDGPDGRGDVTAAAPAASNPPGSPPTSCVYQEFLAPSAISAAAADEWLGRICIQRRSWRDPPLLPQIGRRQRAMTRLAMSATGL